MFTFGYCNGNAGMEHVFDTLQEAERAAGIKWDHLTPREKVKYTDPTTGAYFAVFEGGNTVDDCQIVHDFADDLREESE